MSDTIPLSKLRWHCRRGMRELDVLLERYLQHSYSSAGKAEQQGFVDLLALEDPTLFGYLIGREKPDEAILQTLVCKIREGLREPKR